MKVVCRTYRQHWLDRDGMVSFYATVISSSCNETFVCYVSGTGVLRDWPENTNMQFDWIMCFTASKIKETANVFEISLESQNAYDSYANLSGTRTPSRKRWSWYPFSVFFGLKMLTNHLLCSRDISQVALVGSRDCLDNFTTLSICTPAHDMRLMKLCYGFTKNVVRQAILCILLLLFNIR